MTTFFDGVQDCQGLNLADCVARFRPVEAAATTLNESPFAVGFLLSEDKADTDLRGVCYKLSLERGVKVFEDEIAC